MAKQRARASDAQSKRCHVQAYVPPALKRKVALLAEAEGQTISCYVGDLLRETVADAERTNTLPRPNLLGD